MPDYYDVIIAGGSISGLLAAREVAAEGLSVTVLEEDAEIGTPEHCGGLVSIDGIQNLGIIPSNIAIQNSIKYAKIFSPSKSFELNAEKQKVIVLDRRAFDKQIAFQAQRMGAEIKIKCTLLSISEKNNTNSIHADNGSYTIRTSCGQLACEYFVDARGLGSLVKHNRYGIMQSAQYEVYAPWIHSDTIEVHFDKEKYPGFFAWIIPTGPERAKVGVAGRSINAANALKSYLESKGKAYSVVRMVYAPIWIMGPIEHFVSGRSIIVGDAAGQTKPTTAGGIYSCGMGGVLAGRAIAIAKQKNDDFLLCTYEKKWFSIFKTEFERMILFRKLLERLDNKAMDELFSTLSNAKIGIASEIGDFDFHSAAVSKIFGTRAGTKILKAVLRNEMRHLFNS